MSICTAPDYGATSDTWNEAIQQAGSQAHHASRILADFLFVLAGAGTERAESEPSDLNTGGAGDLLNWSLNELIPKGRPELAPDRATLLETVPFRNGRARCARSLRCCGVCTHQCTQRCIQDCLTRIYMWSRIPEESQSLAVRMLLIQARAWARELRNIQAGNSKNTVDDVCASISWVVGDIISRKANRDVREYMEAAGMRPEDNPYKLDYGPQFEMELSPRTQKLRKKVNKETGMYVVLEWPKSGMCPFCLPDSTINRRYSE